MVLSDFPWAPAPVLDDLITKILVFVSPFSVSHSAPAVFREYETAIDGNGGKGPQQGAYIASEEDEGFHLGTAVSIRINLLYIHCTPSNTSGNLPTKPFSAAKMSTSYKFQGWLGLDPSSVEGNMKWQNYEPKTWEESDVDIKVTHCGICGSDLHTLRSGWAQHYTHAVLGTFLSLRDRVPLADSQQA